MKIPCEIIRDILPLYAEDMVSQPTREMVEEHLGECENCTRELEAMKNPEKPLPAAQIESLKRVSGIIHNSRVLAVAAAVLILLSIGVWAWAFLHVPVYLDVEDAVTSVYQKDSGQLVIDYVDYVRGSVGIAEPGYNQGHICFTTRWDMLALRYGWMERVFDRNLVSGSVWYETDNGEMIVIPADEDTPPEDVIDWATDRNWWYLNYRTAKAGTALWDAGEPMPTGRLANVAGDITVPVLISAILAVALFLIQRRITSAGRKSVLWHISALCAAFFGASLAVTTGQTILYSDFMEPISYILLLTVLLWSTAAVLRKYRRLNMAK